MRLPKGYTLPREVVTVDRLAPEYAPYLGDFSMAGYNSAADKETVEGKLAMAWRDMMSRCYDESYKDYYKYGDVGAFVDARWHSLPTFLAQVKQIPHWRYKLQDWRNFALDKDYYDSACYGPDTAVWVHTYENNSYVRHAVPITATHADGRRLVFLTYSSAASYFGVHNSTILRTLSGELDPKVLKLWQIEVINDGLLRRYAICDLLS